MILRKNDKNNTLPEIDIETATNQEILHWLSAIIDAETEKPIEAQDRTLISECLDFMDELPIDEIAYTEEELKQGLIALKARHDGKDANRLPAPNRKKKPLKIAVILAATFAALFMSLTVAAVSQGYSSAWNYISQNAEWFVGMLQGEEFSENEILYIKGGEAVAYRSIEELLNSENIDIYYPSSLPNDIKLKEVIYHDTNDGSFTLAFSFSDKNLSFSIVNTYLTSESELNKLEKYSTSNTVFYIKSEPNQIYSVIAHINGFEYQIHFNDYDALILILNNMKGLK